jgi:hypothetical protein
LQAEAEPNKDAFNSFLEMGKPKRKAVTEPAILDSLMEARIVRIIEQGGCFGEIIHEGSQR